MSFPSLVSDVLHLVLLRSVPQKLEVLLGGVRFVQGPFGPLLNAVTCIPCFRVLVALEPLEVLPESLQPLSILV